MSFALPSRMPRILACIGALGPCAVFLLSCVLNSHAGDKLKTTMQGGRPDPDGAIERARQGDPDDLLRITRMAATQAQLLPARKPLAQYHQYLQETNAFVQYYAVQVLAGLKDKSSAEPLRQFIMETERRRKDLETAGKKDRDMLAQKEALALDFACQTALMALGDIDEDSPKSVQILASRLKHDTPMEWGGGVAHSALAKKGRVGLRALLDEAAQPMTDDQVRFLESAVNKITDPTVAVDLYACCRDQKYNKKAREAALWSLGTMAKQTPDIEQMVISIAEDEKSDLRSMAIGQLGNIGSARSRNKLLELEKTLPGEASAVKAALLKCDSTNRLPSVIEEIMSSRTPVHEKERLWGVASGSGNALLPYAEKVLGVSDENGVPINGLRYRVWRWLHGATRKHYPLELDPGDQRMFQKALQEITDSLADELYQQDAGKWKYSDTQRKTMAIEQAKTIVRRWEKQEKKGVEQ